MTGPGQSVQGFTILATYGVVYVGIGAGKTVIDIYGDSLSFFLSRIPVVEYIRASLQPVRGQPCVT